MKVWSKNLLKDSIVYGFGYGISRFLQIIILPIIAQSLSLGEFGYYSNYVIFYTIAGGFLVLGLDSAVARYFYDSEDKKYHQKLLSSAFYFILVLSLISIIGFSLFPTELLRIIGVPDGYDQALPYVLFCIPAVAMNNFFLSWFKWKRQKLFFLINSSTTVIFLLIPLLWVKTVTFIYVFQVIFWSQVAATILSVLLAFEYLRPNFHFKLMLSMLKYGFPWMLVFVFSISRTYLDRFFLTHYLSDDNYGIYNFSVRVATILSIIMTAFDMSFGPLAFSIWNKKGAPIFFAKLQSLYTFLISVVACFIVIISPIIIEVLGGKQYESGKKILPLLLFGAIPLSLINFSNLGTSYAKKSFLSTASLFAGFGIVLLLNLLFTPFYFQYGAASASLIGHFLIVVIGYYFSKKFYSIPFKYKQDVFIFLFFFVLSELSVEFSFSSESYYYISLQLLILLILASLFLSLLFAEEYRETKAFLKNVFQIKKVKK